MNSKYVQKLQNAHIKFNMGFFFGRKIVTKSAVILMNEKLPKDSYLNHATKINFNHNPEKLIEKTEKIMLSHGVVPAFYLLPTTKPKNLEKLLQKRNYVLFCRDAWMVFGNREPFVKENGFIIRKAVKKDFRIIRDVFNEVFTKGEKDDPYKGLSPLYGEFTLKRLMNMPKTYSSEFFVAIVDGKIVGICNLLFDKKIAALEGLAVLPQFRNMGIGKSLLLICVKTAKEMGIKDIYLATERGSKNEKVFSKIGFHTKMAVKVFAKSIS